MLLLHSPSHIKNQIIPNAPISVTSKIHQVVQVRNLESHLWYFSSPILLISNSSLSPVNFTSQILPEFVLFLNLHCDPAHLSVSSHSTFSSLLCAPDTLAFITPLTTTCFFLPQCHCHAVPPARNLPLPNTSGIIFSGNFSLTPKARLS